MRCSSCDCVSDTRRACPRRRSADRVSDTPEAGVEGVSDTLRLEGLRPGRDRCQTPPPTGAREVSFRVTATDGEARAGVLSTARGEIETPAFMPVGTKATVKTLMPSEVE